MILEVPGGYPEYSDRPPSSLSTTTEDISEILNRLKKIKSSDDSFVQEQLELFVKEWKHETKKEKEELEALKSRVGKRKVQRAEQEAQLAEMRAREQQLQIQQMEEEKQRKHEEKLRRLEEAEKKRQQLMMESQQGDKGGKGGGRNFVIDRRSTNIPSDVLESKKELSSEELATLKQAALSVRIKPLGIDGLKRERLKRKGEELWGEIVRLQTECYDLEEIKKRQEYDYKELKERQKQQLRHKAMKLGLAPEALMGKYPPKILVASKYERRLGLKPFGETKDLFEGGFVKQYRENVDKSWKERQELFSKREFGEIPPWIEESRVVGLQGVEGEQGEEQNEEVVKGEQGEGEKVEKGEEEVEEEEEEEVEEEEEEEEEIEEEKEEEEEVEEEEEE